jgi:hypothetical protein
MHARLVCANQVSYFWIKWLFSGPKNIAAKLWRESILITLASKHSLDLFSLTVDRSNRSNRRSCIVVWKIFVRPRVHWNDFVQTFHCIVNERLHQTPKTLCTNEGSHEYLNNWMGRMLNFCMSSSGFRPRTQRPALAHDLTR